jgi:hypothetical protein
MLTFTAYPGCLQSHSLIVTYPLAIKAGACLRNDAGADYGVIDRSGWHFAPLPQRWPTSRSGPAMGRYLLTLRRRRFTLYKHINYRLYLTVFID